MYSTCIFCHASLGANESIERFPVGRRLAFDAARGRLWVVCRKCERWNLSPLEERWEAIEDCERAYRDTRLRVSTENIGLARLKDGLELVRIGSPQRPELAAWRYGDQFGRRRRRYLGYTALAVGAGVGLLVLGPVTGLVAGGTWGFWNVGTSLNSVYRSRRVRARIMVPEHDEPVPVRLKQLNRVALVHDDDARWALRLSFERPADLPMYFGRFRPWNGLSPGVEEAITLRGDAALVAAGKLLPAINASGAMRSEVTAAVGIVEREGSVSSLFERYAGKPRTLQTSFADADHMLARLPREVRLALEMAAHEDSERRALEGELSQLEDAWREAEEIAAIADDLFLPDATRDRLAALKRSRRG